MVLNFTNGFSGGSIRLPEHSIDNGVYPGSHASGFSGMPSAHSPGPAEIPQEGLQKYESPYLPWPP
ncbi:hypothetical protein SAMN06273570_4921 [Candidatus Pantoea floridensis]|uniref:Uncharacterized protein n=1 Tax=Candidatus Pantoea floridensis TaxID=1938870 RepID=A0A286DRB5_9GAMM|nr:hypothetical protein BX596_5130 [Enterobacteriaceae bacterium JKS000233]SOD61094.1 hypothetical protein SAMN06273570_4921 [Pantoea floridensis]